MANSTEQSTFLPFAGMDKSTLNIKDPVRVLHLTQPDERFTKMLFSQQSKERPDHKSFMTTTGPHSAKKVPSVISGQGALFGMLSGGANGSPE